MSFSSSASSQLLKLYFSPFQDGAKLRFDNNGTVYYGTIMDDRVYVSADQKSAEHVTLVQCNSIMIDLCFRVYANNFKCVELRNKNIKNIKVLT